MLSQEEFHVELSNFVRSMEDHGMEWRIQEHGKFASHRHLIHLEDGSIITADHHIIHNSTYQVPTLWFNFFHENGTPLSKSIVEREILRIPDSESEDSIRQRLSHFEHPFLGVLYYNIHPCQTSKIMEELERSGSYLMTWMSIYGPQIGLKIPDFRLKNQK